MVLRRGSAGDTIIEVLLSATALALVLSISFISANHSLRAGSDAANRNQAVQYASQQIELVRLGLNSGDLITTGAGANIPVTNFCVYLDTTDPTKPVVKTNNTTPCPEGSAGDFGMVDSYDSGRQTFTVTTQWDSSLTDNKNQVVMYYQDPQ